MIYQLVNDSGYPASCEYTNPEALFASKADTVLYKNYLKRECDTDTRGYKVIPYQSELNNKAVTLFNLLVGAEFKNTALQKQIETATKELEQFLDFNLETK